MADLKLDIIVVPTYSTLSLGVMDASTYPEEPPPIVSPSIKITVPGFENYYVGSYSCEK
jgi:hypothetical protein